MLEVLGLILNTQLYSQHLVRGGRRAGSHPQLHSEFEASLEYMSPANQSVNQLIVLLIVMPVFCFFVLVTFLVAVANI